MHIDKIKLMLNFKDMKYQIIFIGLVILSMALFMKGQSNQSECEKHGIYYVTNCHV